MYSPEVKKNFLEAYQMTFGNIGESCRAVKIHRQTFYLWKKDDPEFKAAIDAMEPREDFKDFIEAALRKKIKEGDTACVIFAAKTQVKDRGYIERNEVVLSSDEPIEVELKIT